MQICDKVYDKDAYIEGIIIGQNGNVFKVLWDNGVLGNITEDFEEIKITTNPNIKKYLIVDILHTGHHGPEFESKVGAKYDQRRGKVFILDTSRLEVGEPVKFKLCDEEAIKNSSNDEADINFDYKHLITTDFQKIYEEDGYTMLRTFNSIYKLKELCQED